jgi:hypothetical protein
MTIDLKIAGLAALLALTACGGPEKGAGGLTADEERQLDNAAAMLDANNIELPDDSLVARPADLDVPAAANGAGTPTNGSANISAANVTTNSR